MKLKAGLLTLLTCGVGLTAAGQNLSEIAKSDPLIISGAIGTQNTFNYSTNGGHSSSVWNNSLYANLNFQVYGVNMPFSFAYSNSGQNFSYPTFSFRINPTWRNWTLHVGTHTMAFSNYIYNIPNHGVGLEYQSNKLRFGAFYGELRKCINDDPLDPTARNPQYQRMGWGFKAGVGSSSRYLDIFIFRAKDRISSLDDRWYDRITPHENLVLGAKGRFNIKRFTLMANFATSAFTTDTHAQQIDHRYVGDWDKIFDARLTSHYRFAGDINVSWGFREYNITASYKVVQPDYMTLGTNYISNNVQSYGITASGSLFRNRVNFNGNFSAQKDNLTKRQIYTTGGYVYGANLSWILNNNINLNGGYSGYRQVQTDGTQHVCDSTKVDRIMHNITGGINCQLMKADLGHFVGMSYNFSRNKDLNHYSTGEGDIDTHAVGASYSLSVPRIGMNFNLGYNWQRSKDFFNTFSTNMFMFGTSRGFLKDRKLNISLNANYSINECAGQSTSSVGATISAGYNIKQMHMLSLSGSYNKYSNTMRGVQTSLAGTNYTVSLNYNYTFTLVHIKRKMAQKSGTSLLDEFGKMIIIGN